jgi:hypothetical protein
MKMWVQGNEVIVRFEDKTEEPRTYATIMDMVNLMTSVANIFDFDLVCAGGKDNMYKVLQGESDAEKAFAKDVVDHNTRKQDD